ncbi:MAG: hypothetical protein RLZZ117_438 [Cyanobacteriota bacterium]|jgi:SAM-dependent methyltransferase
MTSITSLKSRRLDFDPQIYTQHLLHQSCVDISSLDADFDSLYAHWVKLGLDHSILASSIDTRQAFLELLDPRQSRLIEIGPFYNPAYRCSDQSIKYADVLTTEQLTQRAIAMGGSTENIPNIDYIYRDGLIDARGAKFDAVFSSHVLEHQPNLIGHLLNVIDLLDAGGKYHAIVPDYRFCFDRFMTPSSLAEVLAAHFESRTKPTLKSVFEHRLFTIAYDQLPHVNPYEKLVAHAKPGLQAALQEFASSDYVDVHCWYFTPKTLKVILEQCIEFSLLPGTLDVQIFPLKGEIGCIIQHQIA